MKVLSVPVEQACQTVAMALRAAITKHETVLWFVSGGSCVAPQVNIIDQLSDAERAKLTVLLVDERYGVPGHADSNYTKLTSAGFQSHAVAFDAVLQGLSLAETVARYRETVDTALAKSGAVIATLGIGQDGHTAGILPESPAAHDNVSTVIGYGAADFTRLTVGFSVLQQITEAFVFAYGEAKREALTNFLQRTVAAGALPSQILYEIPAVTVYTDTIQWEETV